MTLYWLMFLLPASYALGNQSTTYSHLSGRSVARFNVAWIGALLVLTLLIGYRYEVGGDWGNYLRHLAEARFYNVGSAISNEDPAYRLLNLLAFKQGWGIASVNLISAFLFSVGLLFLCRSLPRPWLALAIAMPYLVVVVAMGYTRQSVALGLAMLGLVALGRKENRLFVFWVLLAATFHKSAALMLPIAALAATRNKYWTTVWVGIISLGAYYLFLNPSADAFYATYIEAQIQSQGAVIRAAMNLVPACLYLLYQRRFDMAPAEANLWRWFSIIAVVLSMMAVSTPATTAVDRIALYILPLQLVVFTHLPDALGRKGARNTGLVSLVLFYYACVLFVWLNFAVHSKYWLPYRFFPFEAWN